jgi:hypothetical protein
VPVAGAVVAPSAGAVVAPAAAVESVLIVEVADESVVVAGADSVEVDSVVVVDSAGFDSQEVRTVANAKARADTFRRFFILVLGLKSLV